MKILAAAILLFTAVADAQNFSLEWFTIDGGGGTSAAGRFSVSGTIGQPDAAGEISNGAHAVVGGFWSFASETVALAVSNSAAGVVVYWNRPALNWVLDESPVVLSTPPQPWTQVLFPYQTNATHIYVTIPAPVANKFYRLRKL